MPSDVDPGIDGLSEFRRIGSGGFSTVYVAWEPAFSRWVAVKVLHDLDAAGARRFQRELSLMGQSSGHPNVTTPIRYGLTASGNPYLVMQYMEGGSLQDIVDRGQVLAWPDAISIIRPIAEALGDSHQQGILHKDVKPANILLARNGTPTLTDFGIAGLHGATATRMAYTFPHSPPETFRGGIDTRDERSDLYSLASTLYTIVAGRTPFESDDDGSELAWLTRIADHPVPRLGVNARLDEFLATAMAKDPAHRPQSAAHFIAALDDVANSDGSPGPGRGVLIGSDSPATRVTDPEGAGSTVVTTGTPAAHAGQRGGNSLGWLAAAVALVALAASAWFAFGRTTNPTTASSSTAGDVLAPTTVPSSSSPPSTAGGGSTGTSNAAPVEVQEAITLLQDPDSDVRTLVTGGFLPTTDVSDGGFTFRNCETQLVGLQTAFGGSELAQLRQEIAQWPSGSPNGYVDPAGAGRGFQSRLDAYVEQTATGYQRCLEEADIRPVGTHVLSGWASIQALFCVTGVVTEVVLADGARRTCPTEDESGLCVAILDPLLEEFFAAFPASRPSSEAACQAALEDDPTLFAAL